MDTAREKAKKAVQAVREARERGETAVRRSVLPRMFGFSVRGPGGKSHGKHKRGKK